MRTPFKTGCKLESKVTKVVLYMKLQENRTWNLEFCDEHGKTYISSLFILEEYMCVEK
jgi:hypothetical protein